MKKTKKLLAVAVLGTAILSGISSGGDAYAIQGTTICQGDYYRACARNNISRDGKTVVTYAYSFRTEAGKNSSTYYRGGVQNVQLRKKNAVTGAWETHTSIGDYDGELQKEDYATTPTGKCTYSGKFSGKATRVYQTSQDGRNYTRRESYIDLLSVVC